MVPAVLDTDDHATIESRTGQWVPPVTRGGHAALTAFPTARPVDDDGAITARFNDSIDELVDDDRRAQEAPRLPPGKEGVRAFFDLFHGAFPDVDADIQGIVSEGNEVWVYALLTGTHHGEFLGIAATGTPLGVVPEIG